MLARSLES